MGQELLFLPFQPIVRFLAITIGVIYEIDLLSISEVGERQLFCMLNVTERADKIFHDKYSQPFSCIFMKNTIAENGQVNVSSPRQLNTLHSSAFYAPNM